MSEDTVDKRAQLINLMVEHAISHTDQELQALDTSNIDDTISGQQSNMDNLIELAVYGLLGSNELGQSEKDDFFRDIPKLFDEKVQERKIVYDQEMKQSARGQTSNAIMAFILLGTALATAMIINPLLLLLGSTSGYFFMQARADRQRYHYSKEALDKLSKIDDTKRQTVFDLVGVYSDRSYSTESSVESTVYQRSDDDGYQSVQSHDPSDHYRHREMPVGTYESEKSVKKELRGVLKGGPNSAKDKKGKKKKKVSFAKDTKKSKKNGWFPFSR